MDNGYIIYFCIGVIKIFKSFNLVFNLNFYEKWINFRLKLRFEVEYWFEESWW